ncbi:MAG: hypothetical protein KKC75_02775 [Nanoarchaeota archaeon]|nr:hypothetical protein [Nanoarchaeota archaeon]MBU1004551.1 hypothetical protein [Nanoarchaeota archaeon]MBU1945722.1 hypothetical protein [Nanoarchaeota archaeon]
MSEILGKFKYLDSLRKDRQGCLNLGFEQKEQKLDEEIKKNLKRIGFKV